jgi:hypothetical protein
MARGVADCRVWLCHLCVSFSFTPQLANAVQDAGAAFASEPARASSLLAWAKAGVVRWAEALLTDGSACDADATLHELAAAARIALAHAALLEPYGLCMGPLLASLLVRLRCAMHTPAVHTQAIA